MKTLAHRVTATPAADRSSSLFRSALTGPGAIDPAAPGGLEALLAFHRDRFGDARMEGAGDEAGGDGAGEPSAGPGGGSSEGKPEGAGSGPDRGFPANTAVADMSVEQQLAYWKFQSRKHEDTAKARADYDEVKRVSDQRQAELEALQHAQMTESEKALAAARAEGAAAAKAEADTAYSERERSRGLKLVDDFLALATGAGGTLERDRDRVGPIFDHLDKAKFLTAEGDVDTAALGAFIASLASATPQGGGRQAWPATGQGRREAPPVDRGVSAGKEMYEARRKPAKPAS